MRKKDFKFYLPIVISLIISIILLSIGYPLFLNAGEDDILITVGGILITLGLFNPVIFICPWLVHNNIV